MDDNIAAACRVCMEVPLEFVHFDCELEEGLTLRDFYARSTHLEVTSTDKLPDFLCNECTNELRRFLEFVKKAENSERILQKSLGSGRVDVNAEKDAERLGFAVDHQAYESFCETAVETNRAQPAKTSYNLDIQVDDEINATTYTSEPVDDAIDISDTEDPGAIRLDDFTYKELVEPKKQSFQYVCSQCNEEFSLKVELSKHIAECHDDVENLCKLCGKKCKSEAMLTSHLFQHKDLRTYSCKRCSLKYFTKFGLRLHVSEMHVKDANTCTICRARFTSKEELDQHTKSAHQIASSEEIKKYPCHLCDKQFGNPVHLKHHILVHKGIQPYWRYNAKFGKKHECHICSKTFRNPSDLTKHLLGHEGKYPYNCPDCNRGFKRKYRFRAHLQEQHTKTLDINDKVVDWNPESQDNEQMVY